VETHAHADHITSAGRLAEHTGARTAVPAGCGIGTAAVQLARWRDAAFGGETLRALHTPGHTAGSMSYLWRDHVFTGDTLLINGCGRTDFQSGSAADLYRSITGVLFALPEGTTVWPGHDYNGRSHSTIGAEKANNARVAGRSQAEFVALMESLHLPRPRRIDEAVPANLHSGLRHDADGATLQAPRAAEGYAGDVSAHLAWQWVQDGQAVLIDVRSDAEREWVGQVPGAIAVAWKQWPGMVMNADFDASCAPPCPKAAAPCCCAAAACARWPPRAARPSWASPPTTSSKALRATPTAMRSAAKRAAGAGRGCPGASHRRRQHPPQVGAVRRSRPAHAAGAGRRVPGPHRPPGRRRAGRSCPRPRACWAAWWRATPSSAAWKSRWSCGTWAAMGGVVAEEAGLTNGYDHPSRLGSDRWVAMIGARHHVLARAPRPLVVVMVGTAVTVDAIDAEGAFWAA
jgi:hypothetical protein